MSVNGHPNSEDRQNNQQYEYYYYDDEYYYVDDAVTNTKTVRPTAAVNTKPPVERAGEGSLSDAKEAIAQYDIDELVKAWREYMEEKEEKENKAEKVQRYSI